jgi:hypothetical protein
MFFFTHELFGLFSGIPVRTVRLITVRKSHMCNRVPNLLVSVNIEQQGVGIQHDSVAASSDDLRNFTSSVNSLQVQETRLVLDSFTNEFCTLGFTLSADNDGLLLLSSLVNNESSSLCILLSNLFSFDSTFETGTMKRLDGLLVT